MITEKIGIAKRNIKQEDTIAVINLNNGRITSDSIKFLPWGKKKLLGEILYHRRVCYDNQGRLRY